MLLETTEKLALVTLERAAVARAQAGYPGYLGYRPEVYACAHPARRTASGSTFDARIADTMAAAAETSVSKRDTAISTEGSLRRVLVAQQALQRRELVDRQIRVDAAHDVAQRRSDPRRESARRPAAAEAPLRSYELGVQEGNTERRRSYGRAAPMTRPAERRCEQPRPRSLVG